MTPGFKLVLVLVEIMTVLSAVAVTFHPNILYASVALLFSFFGVAVMFIFAGADFLGGVQVIVYVGGVTILILFAIMLTQWLGDAKLSELKSRLAFPVVIVAPILIFVLASVLGELGTHVLKNRPENFEAFAGSAKTLMIGQALLGNYILPFEAITILLLGALVGGVWLARPK